MVQEVIFLRKFQPNFVFLRLHSLWSRCLPTTKHESLGLRVPSVVATVQSMSTFTVILHMRIVMVISNLTKLSVVRLTVSKLNAADILTKALTSPDVFADLRRRIMGHQSLILSACVHLRR